MHSKKRVKRLVLFLATTCPPSPAAHSSIQLSTMNVLAVGGLPHSTRTGGQILRNFFQSTLTVKGRIALWAEIKSVTAHTAKQQPHTVYYTGIYSLHMDEKYNIQYESTLRVTILSGHDSVRISYSESYCHYATVICLKCRACIYLSSYPHIYNM